MRIRSQYRITDKGKLCIQVLKAVQKHNFTEKVEKPKGKPLKFLITEVMLTPAIGAKIVKAMDTLFENGLIE